MLVAQKQTGPEWLDVGGARVLFAPIDRAMYRKARKAAMMAGGDDANADDRIEAMGDALSYALIMSGVQDWQDVCVSTDEDDTTPTPFSPEALADVLADPVIFGAFDAAYVVPFLLREREKNVSAGSPDGTGMKATPAQTIAASPASPTSGDGAKPAATPKTHSRPTKPRASGTS